MLMFLVALTFFSFWLMPKGPMSKSESSGMCVTFASSTCKDKAIINHGNAKPAIVDKQDNQDHKLILSHGLFAEGLDSQVHQCQVPPFFHDGRWHQGLKHPCRCHKVQLQGTCTSKSIPPSPMPCQDNGHECLQDLQAIMVQVPLQVVVEILQCLGKSIIWSTNMKTWIQPHNQPSVHTNNQQRKNNSTHKVGLPPPWWCASKMLPSSPAWSATPRPCVPTSTKSLNQDMTWRTIQQLMYSKMCLSLQFLAIPLMMLAFLTFSFHSLVTSLLWIAQFGWKIAWKMASSSTSVVEVMAAGGKVSSNPNNQHSSWCLNQARDTKFCKTLKAANTWERISQHMR